MDLIANPAQIRREAGTMFHLPSQRNGIQRIMDSHIIYLHEVEEHVVAVADDEVNGK